MTSRAVLGFQRFLTALLHCPTLKGNLLSLSVCVHDVYVRGAVVWAFNKVMTMQNYDLPVRQNKETQTHTCSLTLNFEQADFMRY